MATVRRAPKSRIGGRGNGLGPAGVERFLVRGRACPQSANDNAPIHGGREAFGLGVGIVLTLAAWVAVLHALS